jgi:hypothetical protein
MGKKRKTQYAKKAKRQSFMKGFGSQLNTKGDMKNTALETGKDILVCVLGGGLLGAVIGRPSLAVGIVTTGVGHFSGSKLTQLLGIGMMATSGFQRNTAVSGLDGLDGVKERIQAYKEGIFERLYLDKFRKKTSASTTSGIGELQYFSYPNNDLAALDAIEGQLTDSAFQFQGSLPEADFGETELEIGDLNMEDRLY